VAPVVTPPTGDSTYLRRAGGNSATAPLSTDGINDSDAISSCKVNGRFAVPVPCYATIASAVTAATAIGGTIQVTYNASGYTIDTVSVPSNVNIECDPDLRVRS
jgi:hypothetical protein